MPEIYRGLFEQIQQLCKVLEVKAKFGLKLKAAYDADDRRELRRMEEDVLPELQDRVVTLHALHAREWAKLYKPFGWEVIDLGTAAWRPV